MKRIAIAGLLLAALSVSLTAQPVNPLFPPTPSYQAGTAYAANFAYGTAAQPAPLTIGIGNSTTGSGSTITLNFGNITTAVDNITWMPLATNAPITAGVGANAETVTPSAVSCRTPTIYQTCTVTANFSYIHGVGDLVSSGTVGLQESLNYIAFLGGGTVAVDTVWAKLGGTTAMITAANPYSGIAIFDYRGVTPTFFWSMQPTTLTSLAVPATLTSSTMTWTASPVGTWANAVTYACVTYVDALGGEGPCGVTYSSTPTVNYSLNIVSPAASTGAVGYRVYAGTGSLAAAYLLPITSSNCVLSPYVSTIAACAIGANALFPTSFVNTSELKPNTQGSPTINVNQTMPQGHTTFAYQPTNVAPVAFQSNFGPFPAFGSLTAGQIAILGTAQLPPGYLNAIGRTIRVSGKIALTTLNTATLPYITVSLGWGQGQTSGLPVAVCSIVPAAAGATATANETFSCTMVVNAVGATAVGTVMTNGWELLAPAAGGALTGATIDTGTAAIGSLGLFSQDTLYVIYTSTTNATGGEQLLSLNIETVL